MWVRARSHGVELWGSSGSARKLELDAAFVTLYCNERQHPLGHPFHGLIVRCSTLDENEKAPLGEPCRALECFVGWRGILQSDANALCQRSRYGFIALSFCTVKRFLCSASSWASRHLPHSSMTLNHTVS